MKKHVNKLGVFRDSYQHMNYTPNPQNMVVVPPNLLDSGASNVCPSSPCATTTKAPTLSRFVRARTYIKNTVGILVPIFFWVHEG